MWSHDRLTRIVALPGQGILAADISGRLHLFDSELRLLRSSSASAATQDRAGDPIYGLLPTDDGIITRDKRGNICRWDARTLRLLDRIDATAAADRSELLDGEQPSTTILRGIGVWDGKLYLNNGYFQVLVIDLATFTVERTTLWAHGYRLLEWFCTDAPGVHVVSDRRGRIYFGDLATLDFPHYVEVDISNVHRVIYDARHERFWATTDGGIDETRHVRNGIVVFDREGTVRHRLDFAVNDVEGLAFSPDQGRVYCGGFDGELLVFDNTEPELRIERVVGGFSHQIIDLTVAPDGRVYVLTQDGEITAHSADGRRTGSLGYLRQCVWDLQPLPGRPGELLAATDDGAAVLRLLEPAVGHPALTTALTSVSGLGFTRRAVPLADGGWVSVHWPRSVRRTAPDGTPLWTATLPGIVHTLAVRPDGARVLVACNTGAVELDAASGTELGRLADHGASAWACAYLGDGRRVAGFRDEVLNVYEPDDTVAWTVDLGSYPKRVVADGSTLRVSGGGGIKEYEVGEPDRKRQFEELLDNTVESYVLVDGVLCAVTYGMQIAAFDYASGELIALLEDLPDFPKGLGALHGADGTPYVVVGGRGGFLRLYRLDRKNEAAVLAPVRDLWLEPGTAPESAAEPFERARPAALAQPAGAGAP